MHVSLSVAEEIPGICGRLPHRQVRVALAGSSGHQHRRISRVGASLRLTLTVCLGQSRIVPRGAKRVRMKRSVRHPPPLTDHMPSKPSNHFHPQEHGYLSASEEQRMGLT